MSSALPNHSEDACWKWVCFLSHCPTRSLPYLPVVRVTLLFFAL